MNKNKFKLIVKNLIKYLLLFLITNMVFYHQEFPELNFATAIYQITSPLNGTSNDVITLYICKCIFPYLILIYLLKKTIKHFNLYSIKYYNTFVYFALLIIFFIYSHIIKVDEYIYNLFQDSHFIEENINYPDIVNANKRNLILIYLESMENTYMDKDNGGMCDI